MASETGSSNVTESETYSRLMRRRSRFAWRLTAIMLAAYFSFIGLVAFDKTLLARPIGAGATTLGIPVGLGLILLTIALTGIYVARANGEFDDLTRQIKEEAGE
ncbi:DUF485 domain-containing protein [Sphingopyxis granuli]|uniref:DUF485 domain-containing protein n=1 Tax=Sphingopyxis granuli TaxID=267128 RepID=UPI00301CFD89